MDEGPAPLLVCLCKCSHWDNVVPSPSQAMLHPRSHIQQYGQAGASLCTQAHLSSPNWRGNIRTFAPRSLSLLTTRPHKGPSSGDRPPLTGSTLALISVFAHSLKLLVLYIKLSRFYYLPACLFICTSISVSNLSLLYVLFCEILS